jgi:hypothetical protein
MGRAHLASRSYRQAQEFSRDIGDWVWYGGACEARAASIVLAVSLASPRGRCRCLPTGGRGQDEMAGGSHGFATEVVELFEEVSACSLKHADHTLSLDLLDTSQAEASYGKRSHTVPLHIECAFRVARYYVRGCARLAAAGSVH